MSYIILRDIPREEARLDMSIYEIKGGFRGFAMVPAGPHYVAVRDSEKYKSFWCYVNENQAVVKILDYESGEFTDDTENGEQFRQMAVSGAMNHALIQYAKESYPVWKKLTMHITRDNFPPELHKEKPPPDPDPLSPDYEEQIMNRKTRYEQAFSGTHEGNIESFLSEFEFSFLRWFVDNADTAAFERWRHLVQGLYGAGERRIEKTPGLFISLVDVIITQMDLLPDDFFTPDSFLAHRAPYLAEDMMDSDSDEVEEKGRLFSAYLEKRGISG